MPFRSEDIGKGQRSVDLEQKFCISCQELPDLVPTVKDIVRTYFVPSVVPEAFQGEGSERWRPDAVSLPNSPTS